MILSFDVGVKNLAFCVLDWTGDIHEWGILDISGASYEKQFLKLSGLLDELDFHKSVEIVLIERQPSCNPKMRIISAALHMYYIIRGLKDEEGTVQKVLFYSPKHKLNCYTPKEGDEPIVIRAKTPYARRKRMSIIHTRFLLRDQSENDRWSELFARAKKKDDYADSFLQGLSYLNQA